MNIVAKFTLVAVLCCCVCANVAAAAAKKQKNLKSSILREKETNAVDFIRLAVMRLVYGIATRVGLGEQISEALNGAFVPPGVDDYSDFGDGFGLFGRDDYEDDYDYR